MCLYWLCVTSFLIIFNSIQIKLSRSIDCSDNFFSGNPCKFICKEGLRQGQGHCFSCTAGLLIFKTEVFFMWLFLFCVAYGSVMQLGLVLGLVLSVTLVVVLQFASRLFTKDINVLQLIGLSIPVFPPFLPS